MAQVNKNTLKEYFETGSIPNQSNFEDLIDSNFNLSDNQSEDIPDFPNKSGNDNKFLKLNSSSSDYEYSDLKDNGTTLSMSRINSDDDDLDMIQFSLTYNPDLPVSNNIYASDFNAFYDSTYLASGSTIAGIKSVANSLQNHAGVITGGDFNAIHSGSGYNDSTSLYGLRTRSRVTNASGFASHSIGIKVNSPVNNGSVNNHFGLYVADQDIGTQNIGSSAIHIEGSGINNAITWSGTGGSNYNGKLFMQSANDLRLYDTKFTIYPDAENFHGIEFDATDSGVVYQYFKLSNIDTFSIRATATIYQLTDESNSRNFFKYSNSQERITLDSAELLINNLPTTDPSRANQLWNDSGTLKVSAG